MNIIEKRVEEIKEDLEFFDDELAKYEYIIDLGKRLEPFKEEDKIPANIVHGCTSQVWLTHEIKDWHAYLGNETIADAMMDRLIHTAHKLELKGGSMREYLAKK